MSAEAPETGGAREGVTVQKETGGEQIGGPSTVLPAGEEIQDPQAQAQQANQAALAAQANAAQAPSSQPASPFVSYTAPMRGTANESLAMPPNSTAVAARAHAMLGHFINMARAMQTEIERYVPPEMVQMGERDVLAFVRSAL